MIASADDALPHEASAGGGGDGISPRQIGGGNQVADRQAGGGAAEAVRRAEIVRRYVALDLPTEADDESFAEELGLSVDALFRLAASWRLHRDPLLLQGSRTRPKEAQRRAALTVLVDLAEVPDHRQDEVRRRIAIIRRYIATSLDGGATSAFQKACAEEMGVSVSRLHALVRAWTAAPRASSMPGVVRKSNRWRRNQGGRRRVRALVEAIVAESPGATLEEVWGRHVAAAKAEDLKPLGRTSVYLLMRSLRSALD